MCGLCLFINNIFYICAFRIHSINLDFYNGYNLECTVMCGLCLFISNISYICAFKIHTIRLLLTVS